MNNNTRKKRYYIIVGLSLIFSTLFSTNFTASDNMQIVFFSANNNQTNIVYNGDYELLLTILFKTQCSNFHVYYRSPLFTREFSDSFNEEMVVDSSISFSNNINSKAAFGEYQIRILLNYTDVEGNRISEIFYETIFYINGIEISDVQIPSSNNKSFSITVVTDVVLDELEIFFDTDGDLELDNYYYQLNNVDTGEHIFTSSVSRSNTVDGGGQEVGYHVIGRINGRTFELLDKNIEVSITWEEGLANNNTPKGLNNVIIIVLISLLIIINLFIICRFKFKKT